MDQNAQEQGANVWYSIKRKKRRRAKNEDAGDIDNWQGPWAKYKVRSLLRTQNCMRRSIKKVNLVFILKAVYKTRFEALICAKLALYGLNKRSREIDRS